MYSEYYTLRGLILSEDKILKESDKERLLKYLDEINERYPLDTYEFKEDK